MTKKGKILKAFNESEWIEAMNAKTITYDDFRKVGLNPSWEYGEKYNDVIYAARIIRAMGYRVCIGHSFHVYKILKTNHD